MSTFILGAGVSYDSNPANPPGSDDGLSGSYDYRPPLVAGLFAPTSDLGKTVLARNPRAIPLVMELAAASRRGRDIEEELEQLAGDHEYSLTEPDLLAMRAHLAEIATELPNEWLNECQGPNQLRISAEKAHRWNCHRSRTQREPLACITFNHDTLLEDAMSKAFRHTITSMDAYTTSNDVHVYKPHGSVTWRNPATWDIPANNYYPGRQALTKAIDRAATIKVNSTNTWAYTPPTKCKTLATAQKSGSGRRVMRQRTTRHHR